MRAPLLLDLPPAPQRPRDIEDEAVAAEHEPHDYHSQPRLALYASQHSRSGRPRFVGPAPRLTRGERFRAWLSRVFGTESAP